MDSPDCLLLLLNIPVLVLMFYTFSRRFRAVD